jgi:hypothetical protein
MAGSGIRVFASGEILTAAQVNGYLMDQAVTRFADAATRDASFGGAGQPVLTEGRICYLDDVNVIQYFDGASWVDSSQFTVGDGTISTAKLADDAVTSAKIADGAITAAHIADGTIIAADIADGSVTSAKILDGTIVNADINASAAIAYSKLSLSNSIATTDLATGAARAGFNSTQNQVVTASSNYTLVLGDLAKLVEVNEASACTLTIPTNASVAFAVGDRIDVLQTGAGQVTITPVSGTVTINGFDGGLKLNGQWAAATLIKRATNTWVAVGNLTT